MIEFSSDLHFLIPHRSSPNLPLMVFLPGMDETGKELLSLETKSLEADFDVRCLVIPPNNFMTWEQLTESTIALIQVELEKSLQQTVYLCGESLGGCLALKLIERAPYLFKRLILVNSASSFHRVVWLNRSSRLLAWIPPVLYKLSPIVILWLTSALTRIPLARLQILWKAAQSAPKKTAEYRLSQLSEFRIDESHLRCFSHPVLLIASQADRLLPSVSEAQRLSKIFPTAQVVVLPHSGHTCLVEPKISLYQILQAEHFVI
ncbi:alpha/beta fold hydrolase [Leptolyngbya sp. NIES-2104]|uniref:alpha/beta fold hydrolase n=1 Tax=Leptolyngbya sp. NIES-2104 TaxID=1552121 RepID=UPI0006EC608B|nr:alpha/beta hydrolase [Leptolyngbya sp. NIES-2104]GAP99470.1 esterase/lipase/thioesterase family [Leptolyngbya sp. NIES-2104]